MKMVFALCILSLSIPSFAGVECTKEDKSKWQDQDAFKKKLEADYKIKIFKVTKGNCYEIYGWDKAGKKIEIYFHPITGAKVKERIQ